MSVFISYSSKDGAFVSKLAAALMKKSVIIWLDKLEMKPGDSLLDKVQEGLDKSDFLLVVLSKNSVESQWCKKELNSIMMSEINEKRSRIIPVLIEDCKIPLFLQERVYANFKDSFEMGFGELLRSLAPVINNSTGRDIVNDTIVDFAHNWSLINDKYVLNLEFVIWIEKEEQSIILQVQCIGNDTATNRYKDQAAQGMELLMKESLILFICEYEPLKELVIIVGNEHPYLFETKLVDSKLNLVFDIQIRAVLLGMDNGMDKLLNFLNYIEILEKDRESRRKLALMRSKDI